MMLAVESFFNLNYYIKYMYIIHQNDNINLKQLYLLFIS